MRSCTGHANAHFRKYGLEDVDFGTEESAVAVTAAQNDASYLGYYSLVLASSASRIAIPWK